MAVDDARPESLLPHPCSRQTIDEPRRKADRQGRKTDEAFNLHTSAEAADAPVAEVLAIICEQAIFVPRAPALRGSGSLIS
jgi:hypothetical protein